MLCHNVYIICRQNRLYHHNNIILLRIRCLQLTGTESGYIAEILGDDCQSNGRNEVCRIFRRPFDSCDYGESCKGQKIRVVVRHSVKEAKDSFLLTHPLFHFQEHFHIVLCRFIFGADLANNLSYNIHGLLRITKIHESVICIQ